MRRNGVSTGLDTPKIGAGRRIPRGRRRVRIPVPSGGVSDLWRTGPTPAEKMLWEGPGTEAQRPGRLAQGAVLPPPVGIGAISIMTGGWPFFMLD